MFCPKCGKAEQVAETYCRHCGTYLPDPFQSPRKATPAEHLKANSVLAVMSGVTSALLAIWLYSFLLRGWDVPPIINYIVAGLLTANFAWQVQTFIRTRKLWGQLKDRRLVARSEKPSLEPTQRAKLNDADLSDIVPASVTDHTTRQLTEREEPSA